MASIRQSILITLLIIITAVLILVEARQRSRKLDDTSCSPADYHFDFTECDANGGRWRVAIPPIECEGEGIYPPIPPKRLNECYKSCRAGQFLNLTSLECEDCQVGTYSLGGGVRLEEWDPLPPNFKTQVEKFHTIFSAIGRQYANDNCSKWGWRSRGDVLMSHGGPCVATLVYSAQLVKEGSLKFTYQYSDDSVLFQFQANSDQCERLREAEASRWPPLTEDGVWRTEVIPLRTGLNIFQWKTIGMDSHRPKPVMIKKIEIEGVGYTSSCNACPPGTFSNSSAANSCLQCPRDTFSDHQATRCMPCSRDTEYAEAGSSECSPRPACSVSDYYQIHTPCNSNNQTRIVSKWVEPKICLESRSDSIKLPPDGPPKECPPCNPGTEYRDGSCQPCPRNQFSDGVTPCTTCPSRTVPDTGHFLTQWYSWPENIHTTCISPENNGCNQAPAWQLNGNSVMSGTGHADWVYLVMTLIVNGFRSRGGIVNGELLEGGRLSFSFEMKCAHCELIFMQGTRTKNATVIQRWAGIQPRQDFSHPVVRNDSYTYSWAFQKLTWDPASSDGGYTDNNENENSPGGWVKSSPDEEGYVKIYNINVTNTIDGGAKSCVPCKEGLIYSGENGESSCISCRPGHYRTNKNKNLDFKSNKTSTEETSECEPCPKGTITADTFATNASSCRSCASGLISTDGITCTTDCLVTLGHRTYDLRPLKGFHMVRGNSLFTASGTQYYHVFNISFCAEANAQCYKNVSLQHGYENQNTKVEALICQSTVFPPTVSANLESEAYGTPTGFGAFASKPLSTHASSLGDHLIGISHAPSLKGISIEESINKHFSHPQQFHFFYSTPESTVACPKGRSTTITFRCRLPSNAWTGSSSPDGSTNKDTNAPNSEITTPYRCPDGTCDGCNFHFMWETQYACHLCTEAELKIVQSECKDGMQEIHYLPSEFSQCLLKINSSWPTSQECKTHMPVAVEIAGQIAVGLTVMLSVTLICFWRRHQKLEYKYMKLVASGSSMSSNSRHHDDPMGCERGMLPVAESCALDPEDVDDDEEENYARGSQLDPQLSGQIKEVSFYSDGPLKSLVSKFSLLSKIKTFTRKGEMGSNLEIMNLTDKEALS